jgi:hypothetical protein
MAVPCQLVAKIEISMDVRNLSLLQSLGRDSDVLSVPTVGHDKSGRVEPPMATMWGAGHRGGSSYLHDMCT